MVAKRFFYVCAGLFLLAGAYALGARSAGAQAPGNSVVACRSDGYLVFTANGDVYYSQGASPDAGGKFVHVNNVFTNVPVELSKFSVGKNEVKGEKK